MRSRTTLRYWSAFVLVALAALVALACTFTQDLDPLSNEEREDGFKACVDPADSVKKCVSKESSRFSCSLNNCNPCFFPNASATVCSNSGQCDFVTCDNGYADCNNNKGDGCETDIFFDADNCNSCGHVCDLDNTKTVECRDGACRPQTCAANWVDCDKTPSNGCECNLLENTCDGRDCIPNLPP